MLNKFLNIVVTTLLFLLGLWIVSSSAELKKYIIYNKKTGAIIESGQINLERDQKEILAGDNSTCVGRISKIIKENIDLNLAFVGLDFPKIDKNCKLNNPDFYNIEKLLKRKEEIQGDGGANRLAIRIVDASIATLTDKINPKSEKIQKLQAEIDDCKKDISTCDRQQKNTKNYAEKKWLSEKMKTIQNDIDSKVQIKNILENQTIEFQKKINDSQLYRADLINEYKNIVNDVKNNDIETKQEYSKILVKGESR